MPSDVRDDFTIMDGPAAAATESAIAELDQRPVAAAQATTKRQRRTRRKMQTSEPNASVPVIRETGHSLDDASSTRSVYSGAQASETVTAEDMSKKASQAVLQSGQVEHVAPASSQEAIGAPASTVTVAGTQSTSPRDMQTPLLSIRSNEQYLSQMDAKKGHDLSNPASIDLEPSPVNTEPAGVVVSPVHVDANSMLVPAMEDPCPSLPEVSTIAASTCLPSQLLKDPSVVASDSPPPLAKHSKTAHQVSMIVPRSRGTSDKAQLARLGQRAPCVICNEISSHEQKDCPHVTAGVEDLHELLDEREKEEPGSAVKASTKAIKVWIERLTTVRNKVIGLENGQISRASLETTRLPKSQGGTGQGQKSQFDQMEHETVFETATERPGQVPQSQSPVSPGKTVQPELATDGPQETILHPLYLKALCRPPKDGTLSRLSTSDAIIETAGSNDEGRSESESDSSGSTEDSSEDASDAEDGIKEANDSTSAAESRDGETNPNQSESEEDITGPSSRSSNESTRSDLSFRKFHLRSMTEAQKNAARQAAPSTRAVDLTTDIDGDVSDVAVSAFTDERPVRQAASDSSIGDFEEEEDDQRTSGSSGIKTMTEPPALIGKSASSSPESRQSSRSFTALERHAGESPMVDAFEGAVALREAIEAEDLPERMAMADMLVKQSIAENLEVSKSHVIPQGPPSPPASRDDDFVSETMSKRLPQTDPIKRTPIVKDVLIPQVEASVALPVDFVHPDSTRRPRSASRHVDVDASSQDKEYDLNRSISSLPSTGSSSPSGRQRNDKPSSKASQCTRKTVSASPQIKKSSAGSIVQSPPPSTSIENDSTLGVHLDPSGHRNARTPIRVSTPFQHGIDRRLITFSRLLAVSTSVAIDGLYKWTSLTRGRFCRHPPI